MVSLTFQQPSSVDEVASKRILSDQHENIARGASIHDFIGAFGKPKTMGRYTMLTRAVLRHERTSSFGFGELSQPRTSSSRYPTSSLSSASLLPAGMSLPLDLWLCYKNETSRWLSDFSWCACATVRRVSCRQCRIERLGY